MALTMIMILALAASFAKATESTAIDFVKQGKSIPNKLIDLGYERLGGLDLRDLKTRIDAIQVRTASALTIQKMNSDGRPTAHWQRDKNQTSVTISPEFWAAYPEARSMIALHEYLGGAGFDDQNYHLSSLLWILSTKEGQNNLSVSEKKSLENSIAKRTQSGGGGGIIGVGGGGDVESCNVKMLVIGKKLRAMGQMRGQERIQGLQYIYLIVDMDINLKWLPTKGNSK